MTEVREGVRSSQRVADIDLDKFGGAACADEFKVARMAPELGIIAAAPDAPSAHDE
ncbi:hypothetical protein [Mycobacterium shigaense]|uniref:Uncharacterized protein n=1 Tax=Mycobacterium shigaense TaxID=722731 RepID=A0A1Z4EH80_9MYCO|nr:hypothetical protein [Mycobacterium shigaense]MEA1123021.1 hypothetical protein [Mycobacterium shigaense]BAX92319.1 hypothetical protein MSG_02170 [Mycobacterium shigaense]